jgi:Ser/Thr protein kinase RdoA (MazF antagonist)
MDVGQNGPVTDGSGLTPAQVRTARALLSVAGVEPAGTLAAEAIQNGAHVFRLSLSDGRSAILKRRDEGQRHGEAEGFGIELAALQYLNAMPAPVAPRLLGVAADAGVMVMEDLGRGPSLADSLLAGPRDRAEADLIAYARALGRVHAWSMSRAADLTRLRGGKCRIFDFETSGWGPVVLDAAYLVAPFPSCWCFGALPDEMVTAGLAAYQAELAIGPLGGTGRAGIPGLRRAGRGADAAARLVAAGGLSSGTA